MIPATLATLALAVLVYAFILSPIIRDLRGGSASRRPIEADLDDDGHGEEQHVVEAADAPAATAVGQPDATDHTTPQRGVAARGDVPASMSSPTTGTGTSASSSGA